MGSVNNSQRIIYEVMSNTMTTKTKAFAYVRTSSAANVGPDRDSEPRQRQAIESYAKRAGIEIVETFRDAAVSGVDNVLDRPGPCIATMSSDLLDLSVAVAPSRGN